MNVVSFESPANEKVIELIAEAGAKAVADGATGIAIVMLTRERTVATMWTDNGGQSTALMLGSLEMLKNDILAK